MCCVTHEVRDVLEREAGTAIAYAEREEFRCQCPFGQQCRRRATDEDFRCDWCRGTNHERWCYENPNAANGVFPGDWGAQQAQVTWNDAPWLDKSGYARGGEAALPGAGSLSAPGRYSAYGQDAYGNRLGRLEMEGFRIESEIPETDLRFTPGEPRAFEFSPEAVSRMQIADSGFKDLKMEFSQDMSVEDVMNYVRRKYGV